MTSTFESRTQAESDQIGQEIYGRDNTSQFGYSVDMNFDGDRIVGGGIEYDNYRGYIAVYDLNSSGQWQLYGSYINGPIAGSKFGFTVSMDYDGLRILVGAPDGKSVYVYDDNGTNFVLSQTITRSSIPSFGYSVSIAADKSDRFVVGAPDNTSVGGSVHVYELSGGSFTESYVDYGNNISNQVPTGTNSYITLNTQFNRYGHSVCMAAFGEHYIVGMPGTRKASYPSSDHSGSSSYGSIYYASLINGANQTTTNSYGYNNVPFYYFFSGSSRPYHQFRFPQFQVGYVRIKKCPRDGNWSTGPVTTVGGTTSTSNGNGGGGTILGPNYNNLNNISNWDDYQGNSFGGFGYVVQITPQGDRIAVSAPGWFNGSFTDSHSGRVLYYEYDESTGNWQENEQPNYNTFIAGQHGHAMAMGSDGSRIFASNYDTRYAIVPYDFSGSEWYRAGYILSYAGSSGQGRLQGFSLGTKSGKRVVMGTLSTAIKFAQRNGAVSIWEYPLTSVFRGNSLFEGYVKAEEMVIGSTTNNTNTKRLLFGGTKGDNMPNTSSIEVRHLGTFGGRDSELLISKWYGHSSDAAAGSMHHAATSWNDTKMNDRFLYGDRLRFKAPKIEFHIQPPNNWHDVQKYNEFPVITVTSQDGGLSAGPVNVLTNIRSGSTTSTKYAGLRLTSSSSTAYGSNSTFPADGDYYTFSPANDGWLRLYGGASGQGNMSGSYAGLAVGNLHVNGSISGPGAPGGSSSAFPHSGSAQISKTAHASGANDYHLELYSGNTGNSSNEVSLRFHQGGRYWGQIRFRDSQFYFTEGSNNNYYTINAGNVNSNGSVYASGNVTAYSDRRKKKNIKIIENPLEKIQKLNGVTYDRIEEDDNTRYTGLIAQEVLEVLPEAVTGDDETGYALAYGNMAGILVEAVKKLTNELEEERAKRKTQEQLYQELLERVVQLEKTIGV